jgi:signal transduction histidine kinase
MARVLVVEDEDQIRQEVIEWLQFEGHEVSGAADGILGLEAARSQPPHLIICDVAMPRMSGHEVLLEIRADPHLNQTPFIFLTAAADRRAMREGMTMGADDYLTKPFTHGELINAVETRLKRKADQDARWKARVDELRAALSIEREKRDRNLQLAAMFSHDFRTPLTTILMCSDMFRQPDEFLTGERQEMLLDRIEGSVNLLLQMLDDMLMVAEMEAGHLKCMPEPLELSSYVAAIVDECRLIFGHTHTLTFSAEGALELAADPKLVRQVTTNLIANAVKYSANNSTVTISVTRTAGEGWIAITDEGIGIPPDAIDTIFEPFQRAENATRVRGSGLGLSIVRQAVELHGGAVEVESTLGVGSTFRVRLPSCV